MGALDCDVVGGGTVVIRTAGAASDAPESFPDFVFVHLIVMLLVVELLLFELRVLHVTFRKVFRILCGCT